MHIHFTVITASNRFYSYSCAHTFYSHYGFEPFLQLQLSTY